MPYYLYSAIDSQGKNQEGTIQATSPGEAVQLLSSKGFGTPRIIAERTASHAINQNPAAPPRAVQQTPAAPHQLPRAEPSPALKSGPARLTQQVRPIAQPGGPVQINIPKNAPSPIHRTKRAKDSEISFLFAQVSDQFRAGINPALAFGELARLYANQKFGDSLAEMAAAAAEGGSISSVMAWWPDLYPEHVVGLMHAGEIGGFLPEAAATVSDQAMSAHKFKRFHWWIWLIGINLLLTVPIGLLLRHWVLYMYDYYEAHPNIQGGSTSVPFHLLTQLFLWPWGPVGVALLLLTWWLRNYFSSPKRKEFRHEIGLKTPILGGRARNESATIFSWALSKLSRSGVPPNQSWQLALASVPNVAMQRRLANAGIKMTESSKLSDVVFESDLFPAEFAPAIATGEFTGDVPGALQRLSQISHSEFEAGTAKSKWFTGGIGCVVFTATCGFTAIIIALAWSGLFNKFYSSLDSETDTSNVSTPASPNVNPPFTP